MAEKKEVKEYNDLVKNLQSKLLTNEQIKRGGSNVRGRYEAEKGYEANVQELNELGRKLGFRDVTLGSLRK